MKQVAVLIVAAAFTAASATAQSVSDLEVGPFGVFEVGWASTNTGDRCSLSYTDPQNYTALAMVWIPSARMMQTALSNQKWESIQSGRTYTVTFDDGDSEKSLVMTGFVQPYRNPKFGVVAMHKNTPLTDFVAEARDAANLTVSLDQKVLMEIDMGGMPEKYNNFVRCFNQSVRPDPFAG